MSAAIEKGLDIIGATLDEVVKLVGSLDKFSHLQELGSKLEPLVESYPGNPNELAVRTSPMGIRTKIMLGGRAKATIEIEYSVMAEPKLDVDIRWTTSCPLSPVRAFILAKEHQEVAFLGGQLEDLFETMARKLEGYAVEAIKERDKDKDLARNIQPILSAFHNDQEARLNRAKAGRDGA